MGRNADLIQAARKGGAVALAELGNRVGGELDTHDKTFLHKQSCKGNLKHVKFLLEKFPHKNLLVKLTKSKHTALHLAAQRKHPEVVKFLINEARKLPYSSSSVSSSSSSSSAIPPVISFEAFLRLADEDDDTALHAAVYAGNFESVKLLVEAAHESTGPHINFKNTDGKTPIYIAAEAGYNKMVKLICRTFPDVSLDGPRGTTALHAAIKNRHKAKVKDEDVIKMLIDAARLRRPESFEAFFNATDKNNLTVLDLAVEGKHVDVVRQILREDPAYGLGKKKNGLMRLIYRAIDKELADIVKLLSEAYQVRITRVVTDEITGVDKDEFTEVPKDVLTLILAIKRRDYDEITRLLMNEPSLVKFAEDEGGWTPLHYVAYQGFDKIVKIFIKVETNVNSTLTNVNHPFFEYKEKVSTPFHVAAEYGHTDTVKELLQLWPSSSSAYTALDKNGRNILHIAAAQNKKEMIQDILENCREEDKDKILNEKDANGNTLLHLLISHGCFIPELLKHEGFDPTTKNQDGWTPRDMLYWKAGIIADQVQIKIALDDDVQTNQSWKFWHKSIKKVMDIIKSIVSSTPENIMSTPPTPNNTMPLISTPDSTVLLTLDNTVPPTSAPDSIMTLTPESTVPPTTIPDIIVPPTSESIVPWIKQVAKDVIFSEKIKLLKAEKHTHMEIQKKEGLIRYKNRTNTQIIVTALITTVTFTVGFTMPGGLRQSGEIDTSKKLVEGLAVFSKKTMFHVFMVSDALALLLSTSSLFFYFLESMTEDLQQVSKFNIASTVLNIVSIIAMMLTFITGTNVVLYSASPTIAITVSVIGSLFLLFPIFMLIKYVYDP